MLSHPKSYTWGWRLHSLEQVKCDDSGPACWGRAIAPRFDSTECLHQDVQWQQKCWHCGKEWYGLPSDPQEDPSGESGSCQSGAWGTNVTWHSRHVGWSPRHPDTKEDHREEAEKAVQEVRFEWLRILAAGAGRLSSLYPCWVSQHFFP